MRVSITAAVQQRLRHALSEAGRREIGGVLWGEHAGPEHFRIVDLTVQMHGGTSSSFTRQHEGLEEALREFRQRYGCDFQRFNYLGEWHSHPSFGLVPSNTDAHTMHSIVDDPETQATFAILLLTRLTSRRDLALHARAYLPGGTSAPVTLVPESSNQDTCPNPAPAGGID